jgi:hypothetical protein
MTTTWITLLRPFQRDEICQTEMPYSRNGECEFLPWGEFGQKTIGTAENGNDRDCGKWCLRNGKGTKLVPLSSNRKPPMRYTVPSHQCNSWTSATLFLDGWRWMWCLKTSWSFIPIQISLQPSNQ